MYGTSAQVALLANTEFHRDSNLLLLPLGKGFSFLKNKTKQKKKPKLELNRNIVRVTIKVY